METIYCVWSAVWNKETIDNSDTIVHDNHFNSS